mgnify:CR=1 FL=1
MLCSSFMDGKAGSVVDTPKSLDARTTMYHSLSMPRTKLEKITRRLSRPIARKTDFVVAAFSRTLSFESTFTMIPSSFV